MGNIANLYTISFLVCSELFDDSEGMERGCPENLIILSAT